jgi:hypothetical protein
VLLDAAYSEVEGFAQIVVGHFEEDRLKIDRQRWFTVPEELAKVEELAARHAASNVYFTVSTFKEKTRTNENTVKTQFLWVDADTCAPENFRVPPTFVVETSPKRYQCYWMLERPVKSERAATLVHKIATAHQDQGCDISSWTPNKLMRVPGSTRDKGDGDPFTVTLVSNSAEQHLLKDLEAAYHDVVVEKHSTVMATDMGELPERAYVTQLIPGELMETFLGGNFVPEKRSEARYQFEADLIRHGLTREEVFVAVQMAAKGRLDKFAQQGRPEYLWHEVCKVAQEVADEENAEVTPGVSLTPTDIDFLSESERLFVADNPTFIEDYVEWVRSRSPRSAEVYQRTLALVVLSSVYGSWAYIRPQWGKMSLNLWCILAGDTTSTRKTTAKSLALNLIRSWEARAGLKIEIGSDTTSEGLTKLLSDRDGLVSLFHRDEFHGFIKEMFTKNYLSGMMEYFTALYDGEVPQTIRATTGTSNDKIVTTIFNFIAMGIPGDISKILNTSNFASGFLPRFLWVVADTPDWEPDHEGVVQIVEDDSWKGNLDEVGMAFRNDFELARRKWNSTSPKQIVFTDDAWQRWNQWKIDSKRFIMGVPNEKILEPARDRMSYSILKASALLAIHDRSEMVTMEHLLPILAQSELWFRDLIKMANSIASSDFEARSDQIEMMIAAAGGTLAAKDVYKAFKNLRKGEVDENINSLKAQGRIKPGKKVNGHETLVAGMEV